MMKLNQEQLKKILEDLYAVDENLRHYEKELVQIICDIVELKPEVKFDENFRLQLRAQLMERAVQLAQEKSVQPAGSLLSWKFSYVLAGALALAVLVFGGGYLAQKQGIIEFPKTSLLEQSEEPFAFKKLSVSDNAFGSLKGDQAVTQAASGVGGGGGARTESGGGDGSSSIAPTYGLGGGGMTYPGVYYRYVYKGEPLELANSEIEVLRRVGFDQNISSFGSLLKSFGLGMVNMDSFSSLKVQNVNLAEDRDFGYFISANVQEGSVYISQNWLKWPQPYKLCVGESTLCVEQSRVKISDVLPDSEVIKIARDFIKAHGINLVSYGEPEITDAWRVEYEKTADKSQFYIPESSNVLFPLKVNGQFVYDEGGFKTGMNLSVDYRQKKVSGAANITSQTYQASNYPAETDSAKILKLVEQGGNYYWGYPMAERVAGSEEKIIEVGTPTRQYVLYSNYSNNQVNFLLVPSLVFPITKTPDDTNYFYQKNIVVPLARELLDQRLVPMQ